MSEESNVVQLVPKVPTELRESKGYIKITYKNEYYLQEDDYNRAHYEEEIIQCDSFAPYSDMKNFIILFRDDPEGVIGIINSDVIRKIEILKEEDVISDSPSN